MSPLGLAWRSLVRQPARSALGVLGVAVVGALLFDMLLLSRGLVLSFRNLLDEVGFDVRVTATSATPFTGPRIGAAAELARRLESLPEVACVVPVDFGSGMLVHENRRLSVSWLGAEPGPRVPWSLVDGPGLAAKAAAEPAEVLVNPLVAREMGLVPGDTVSLVGTCDPELVPLPPAELRVAGVAEFPFDAASQLSVATRLDVMRALCGEEQSDGAGLLLVASSPASGSEAAQRAILAARPDLHAFSNRQLVDRFHSRDFSYFRQISFALSTITLFFAFLLISSLLTVSVNQRFAEVAALRALGFSRRRIVLDLLWESILLVGAGGVLALPLGAALAGGLDRILRGMPGIPERLHFFVFEPRALVLHGLLLGVTGLLAAAYPVFLAARLPIAATLRREIVS